MNEELYCPICGEKVEKEYIYETADTHCTCPFCGWEGSFTETADERGFLIYNEEDDEEIGELD